ncbi:MAG: hypothetical protein ACE5F5_04375 [Acidimicrobiia bacterium]
MSDLVEAAAAALNVPPDLVRRSAAARAEATAVTVDEVLAAWTGGAPVAPTPEAPPAPAAPAETPAAAPEPAPAAVAVTELPSPEPAPTPELPAEPAEPLEPRPLATRLRTATRVGAWLGAAFGFFGFLAASAFWAPSASISPDAGPVVVVDTRTALIFFVLVSIAFGAIVASFSRAATGWADPAMELTNTKSSTAWWGAGAGLVLGLIGGTVLISGLGTAVAATEEAAAATQLPVLTTLAVMVVGGALAGGVTATVPQILGTPVALAEDTEEVVSVKTRLQGAVSVPLAGLVLLLVLVLPFAFTLLRSAELSPMAAPVVAIITAGAILGFATLAGSRPQMKITLGELLVAVVSVATVLLIILAALFYASGGGEEGHSAETSQAVVSARF